MHLEVSEMKLYEVGFLNGHRTAYVVARSITEAGKKVAEVLKSSSYTVEERKICRIEVLAPEAWPGVYGG
jgi:hypothetical protein